MGKKEKVKRNKRSSRSKLILILLLIVIITGSILAYKIISNNKTEEISVEEELPKEEIIEEEKTVEIFSGVDRPIAVMIDNHSDAWPQYSIQDAYLVYEIIVEGGETRLMALYKGSDAEKIGPVRSSRHYFLDYALENDAIYAHFGQSPQALSDINRYNINNISGLEEDGTTFWRVSSGEKYAPHNAVTSIENLTESANDKNYRMTSTAESILNYVTDDIKLEEGEEAISVTIPHSQLQTVKYEYNAEEQVYERYARGKAQMDLETGEIINTKNIIIQFVNNSTIPGDVSGRQNLNNIGTFDGYYITNGRAIEIQCVKDARTEQTKYLDINGNEINVNDGNTFINICPVDSNVILEKSPESNTNITNDQL